MSISRQGRGITELDPASTRTFGLRLAELPSVHQLDLSHNHLRTLECPFGASAAAAAATTIVAGRDSSVHPAREPRRPLRPEPYAADRSAVSVEELQSGLRLLTSLRALTVTHNQLRSLVGLSGAADTLTRLTATHNGLASLDGLQACRSLRYIDVSHNSLVSLRGLPVTHASLSRSSTSTTASFHAWLLGGAAAGPAAAHTDPALALSGIDEATDTSSVAFKFCATPGEEPHRLPLHSPADAAAWGHRAPASADTSVQFQIDDTRSASLSFTSMAFAVMPTGVGEAGDAADGVPVPAAAATAVADDDVEVVLNVSHNRLRGRALATLLWVDAEEAGEVGTLSTSLPPAPLLRPWAAALTHLDISNNGIEDAADVRRLVAQVRWPIHAHLASPLAAAAAPVAQDTHRHGVMVVVAAPLLARLRQLDASHNPFLVNGSLASEVASSAAGAGAAPSCAAPRADAKASFSATTQHRHHRQAVPAVSLQLSMESAALQEAQRQSAAVSAAAGLSTAAAAQLALTNTLVSVADAWRDAPLPTPAHNTATAKTNTALFALFTAAERHTAVAAAWRAQTAAAARCVMLRGGEVAVWAATLRRCTHGPAAAASTVVGASGLTRKAPAQSQPHETSLNATLDVFLTPPPRWGNDTASSSTYLQVSMMSGESPLPRHPPHATSVSSVQQQQQHSLNLSRDGKENVEAATRVSTSALANSQLVEASTVGYRVLAGRGSQSPPPPAASSAAAAEAATMRAAERDARHEVVADEEKRKTEPQQHQKGRLASPAPPAASAPDNLAADSLTRAINSSQADATADLQVYKAEAAALRGRLREVQRQVQEQACVLQRQEAALRKWKEKTAAVQRERDDALKALEEAQQEIARLQQR